MKRMENNIHQKFIQTPIFSILKNTICECHLIRDRIESHPLCEYILQTTFLKMTGASEQKLKCIYWEMATYDYEYRYKKLSSSASEYSSYNDKNKIFKEIQDTILKLKGTRLIEDKFSTDKKKIFESLKNDVVDSIKDSVFPLWKAKEFLLFQSIKYPFERIIRSKEKLILSSFATKNKNYYDLFDNVVQNYYTNVVYKHRNRCAHNLKSYQSNLPTLDTLSSKDYEYENYFHMFFTLILMDKLYMELYDTYLHCLEDSIY